MGATRHRTAVLAAPIETAATSTTVQCHIRRGILVAR